MDDPLARRAARTPDRTAVIEAATGDRWSYAALETAVAKTAGALADHAGPGDHVGVLAGTSPGAVRTAFGAWRAGATVVVLHEALTAAELADRHAVADLDLLVADPGLADRASEAAGDTPVLKVGEVRDGEAVATGAAWSPGETCLLLFTSGTTGEPKAVELTPANLFFSAVGSAFRLGVDPGDRWLDPLSVAHMGGLAPVVRSTLYGTTVVLQAEFDPPATLAALDDYGCTGVSLVPTMLARLLDHGDLPDLRFVLLGGGPIPGDLVERCERRGVPVYPTYGATETASQVATATPAEAFADPGTVGRPLLFTDVDIVDEGGRPLPAGESGEIVVSGPTVSPGYYGDPEATERAFDGGFRTGDRGRLDDAGRLAVEGRIDERITTGGETVDPAEVRAVLRGHPAVDDAAVVGLPDPEFGQRVAALVVADGVDAGTLREYCRDRLAGFKLPRTVAFADSLPRTPSDTVDRDRVRETLERAR